MINNYSNIHNKNLYPHAITYFKIYNTFWNLQYTLDGQQGNKGSVLNFEIRSWDARRYIKQRLGDTRLG